MKSLLFATVVSVLIFGGTIFWDEIASVIPTSTTEYIKSEPQVVEIITDANQARIQSAQAEQMERIEQEADARRQAYIDNELAEIEATVWREIEAEARTKAIEKEKETGSY